MSKPPKHGQIKLGAGMKPVHARRHMRMMETTSNLTKDYGSHAGSGQTSQGAMSPGGSSSADYQTSNQGNTGDCDSGGPSGY